MSGLVSSSCLPHHHVVVIQLFTLGSVMSGMVGGCRQHITAMKGIRKLLLLRTSPAPEGLLYVAEKKCNQPVQDPKMDHLVCFLPGKNPAHKCYREPSRGLGGWGGKGGGGRGECIALSNSKGKGGEEGGAPTLCDEV